MTNAAKPQDILKSLDYERIEDQGGRPRFRNEKAQAEVTLVKVGDSLHCDFSGNGLLGERNVLTDLIFSEDLLKRLTEESIAAQELGTPTGESPGDHE